jgi:hypothetical protein
LIQEFPVAAGLLLSQEKALGANESVIVSASNAAMKDQASKRSHEKVMKMTSLGSAVMRETVSL